MIKDINIILAYSAIKIIAKPPLLYSILNPETISDSPSAKSKGARLVSAKLVINQQSIRGNINTTAGIKVWCSLILKKSNL